MLQVMNSKPFQGTRLEISSACLVEDLLPVEAVLQLKVNGVAYTPVINGNSWSVTVSNALAAGASYEVVATAQRAGTPSVSDTSTLEATITSSPIVAIDITGDSAGDPTHNGSASGSATLPIINGTSSNAGGFIVVRLDPNNDGNLADAAKQARSQFRQALGSYVDLVALERHGGGSGPRQAMELAADVVEHPQAIADRHPHDAGEIVAGGRRQHDARTDGQRLLDIKSRRG